MVANKAKNHLKFPRVVRVSVKAQNEVLWEELVFFAPIKEGIMTQCMEKYMRKVSAIADVFGCLAKIVLGSLLLTFLAKISVNLPFTPVPVTFQTLGVYFLGMTMSPRVAMTSVATYLCEGLFFPVFSGNSFGASMLLGATGGYLLSFIPIVGLIASLKRRFPHTGEFGLAGILLVASVGILTLGASWLASFLYCTGTTLSLDLLSACKLGVLPFIPGDILKIFIAIKGASAFKRLFCVGRQGG